MSDPALSAAANKARWQGIVIGLIVGLVLGGIGGVMLPDSASLSSLSAGNSSSQPRKQPAVPEAPVAISLKGAGAAQVVVVENTGAAALTNVTLTAHKPHTPDSSPFPIGGLAPKESREVGSTKDWSWAFSSGDTFEITADGFAPRSYRAP